jgi:uncharacterized protein (TIGR00159 family)
MAFPIGIKDIFDIVLVAFLLYEMFKLLKKTGAVSVFYGIMTFVIVWFLVSYVFKMELLGGILDRVVSVGAFALIVLFQDEIRQFFSNIGTRREVVILRFLRKIFGNQKTEKEEIDYGLVQIVRACQNMARTKTGALIVIARRNDLSNYAQTGEIINATISSRLVENIFFKNSPLHDGAMLIFNKQIRAAACILPISQNKNIPKNFGLRHRSALGITEYTDAIAIVVSEESGKISWAANGQFVSINGKPEELELFLAEESNNSG